MKIHQLLGAFHKFNNKLLVGNMEDCVFDFLHKITINSEKSLWKAVILQAFVDLKNNSKKKIANTYRVKATLWFNMNNNDFITVCNYANLDPYYVWSKANTIKDTNYMHTNAIKA